MGVWLFILCAFFVLFYIHHYGLPGPLKSRLQSKLAVQGEGLDYTRLRWRWYRGCVVEGLVLSRTNAASIWRLTAREAALDLELSALFHQHLKLRSGIVDHATISWSSRTNSSLLVARNISTEFQLASHDRLVLAGGQADFAGVTWGVTGTLTNISALPQLLARATRRGNDSETTLQRTAGWMAKIQPAGRAVVRLIVNGDVRDPENVKGRLTWTLPALQTPWGHGRDASGMLDFNHFHAPDGRHLSDLRLELAEAKTKWAGLTNLSLTAQFNPPRRDSLLIESRVALRLSAMETDAGRAENLEIKLRLSQSLTNPLPLDLRGETAVRHLETRWGRAESLNASLHIARRTNFEPRADASWGGWARLEPWLIQFEGGVASLETPKIKLGSTSAKAAWSAPNLSVERLASSLYDGGANLQGDLNVASRDTSARGGFDFNIKSINHLLTPATQKWLAQFEWISPPSVGGSIRLRLPAWSDKQPAWKNEVMPTIKLAGEASGGKGAFRGIPATSVAASFAFTNNTWDLSRVHATRPEGAVDFAYHGNVLDHDFRFSGQSAIDPFAVLPVVPAKFRPIFPLFSLNSTPLISGVVTGNWRDRQAFQVQAEVTATNLAFQGAPVDSFHSSVRWTNRWVRFSHPTALSRGREITADLVVADFNAFEIILTNLHSKLDPVLVASLISTNLAHPLETFHFTAPPDITLNGRLSTKNPDDHDLRAEIAAPGLVWRRLETGPLSGNIIWTNRTVLLTNFTARPARGPGALSGHGILRYTPGLGADFSLDATLANLDLHSAIAQVTDRTNRLEGTLDGHLIITSGRTDNLNDWYGYGDLHLRDGFLWELPVFGIISPVLDAIVPGLGKTRAKEASADFLIIHSVISSKDLVIRAPTLLLDYRGTLDFHGNVNAVVEAQVLHDAWVLGSILRVVLRPFTKLFEYQVTGTLAHPHSEPLRIPKILMLPFSPIHTLQQMFVPPDQK